jgi:capsule polysaccharide export protein KpsC/LpsZ
MPKTSQKIGEANYKAAVFQEYFNPKKFAFMQEVDRIDFIITDNADRHLIWAETKKNTADLVEMFVQ